ncbi:hypothetical protein [Paraburkholderia sp. WP4_3_2]|nr:hypothetical protein [Paraburkholderia sp. WP4_3_2]MBB3258297.1 hypothetical protein [Paraburkholderia sp. WP4_3_2]
MRCATRCACEPGNADDDSDALIGLCLNGYWCMEVNRRFAWHDLLRHTYGRGKESDAAPLSQRPILQSLAGPRWGGRGGGSPGWHCSAAVAALAVVCAFVAQARSDSRANSLRLTVDVARNMAWQKIEAPNVGRAGIMGDDKDTHHLNEISITQTRANAA